MIDLPISVLLTVGAGKTLRRARHVFPAHVFPDSEKLPNAVNHLLVVGSTWSTSASSASLSACDVPFGLLPARDRGERPGPDVAEPYRELAAQFANNAVDPNSKPAPRLWSPG